MTMQIKAPAAVAAATEAIDKDRRWLLSTAAAGIAAAVAASLFHAHPAAAATSDTIRPFHVNVPDEDLVELRKRLAATRWPDRETVDDRSQGVQLAKLQHLVRYGAPATTGGRWRRG